MEKRKSGYYWVKYINRSDWVVYLYYQNSGMWYVPNAFIGDEDLGEINETRIMNPDEVEYYG